MSEETAFSLDSDERLAWIIIFGEREGGKFNRKAGVWEKPIARP